MVDLGDRQRRRLVGLDQAAAVDAVGLEHGVEPAAEAIDRQAAEVGHRLLEPADRAGGVERAAAGMAVQVVLGVVQHEVEQRFAGHEDHGPPRYGVVRRDGYSGAMSVDSRAGTLPEPSDLVDLDRLLDAYREPDRDFAPVAFGTSGHRGSSLAGTFNEAHVAAISEAVCRYRAEQGIDGPLFLGRDTHALSEPAAQTIVEVLAAHGVDVVVDARGGATPTPVISHAILTPQPRRRARAPPTASSSRRRTTRPTTAASSTTRPTAARPTPTSPAGSSARPTPCWAPTSAARPTRARASATTSSAYVDDLAAVIDLDLIRESGLKLGVDPLGGASAPYWEAIVERHGLDLEVVNDTLDPTFRFVPLDWDGKVRMDSSSPYAMSRLTDMRDRFDVAFANDPDADRHGIVTPAAGLLNPNHHLAACVAYLFGGHRDWGPEVGVGKTLVSSSIIDRVAADLGRRLYEVPVGFKWFVSGLLDGTLGFGGEESAGASFLRRDGTAWSTDKDGLIPCLLAAEMNARTGEDPGEVYAGLASRFGEAAYRRVDVAATPEQKDLLKRLSPEQVRSSELAGEPITDKLTTAPGNGAPIGGLKVVAASGWFAARPSAPRTSTRSTPRACGPRAPRAHPRRGAADRRRGAGGLSHAGRVRDRAGRRRGQAPLPADARPRRARGAVRRNYRLIDFALSNLVNAGYRRIVVLTQYRAIRSTATSRSRGAVAAAGQLVTPVPAQMRRGPYWFSGSADAIYQNLNLLNDGRTVVMARARQLTVGY